LNWEEDFINPEDEMGTEKTIDIKHYYWVLKKRIWLVVSFVAICAIVTGLISVFFIKPVYQASTKLIVNKAEESSMYQQLDLNAVNTNIKLIDTYKEIIKTPAIMDIVVKENPGFNISSSELIDKVKVNSVNNTQVMTVSVNDFSHANSVKIVNAISKVFQNEIPKIMKVDNVSLLNEARVVGNPKPVSTSPLFNVLVSVLLSFLLISSIVFIIDYLDDTVKTEEDISQILGLPTLSMIPRTRSEDLQPKSSRIRKDAGENSDGTVNE
jgi:capsular polysaccharide biosynthesis protein